MFTVFFSSQIHHFLDFVKQIYKDLPKVVVSKGFSAGGFGYSDSKSVVSDVTLFLVKALLSCRCFLSLLAFLATCIFIKS